MVTDDDEQPEDRGVLASLPAGVRWLTVALFVGVIVLYEGVVPDFMGGYDWSLGPWGVVAVVAAIIVGALAVGSALNRGRLGGADQARLFRVALREGRVPEGADRETWAPEVSRRLAATEGVLGGLLGGPARERRQQRLRVLAEQL